jgi:hypothetical protein
MAKYREYQERIMRASGAAERGEAGPRRVDPDGRRGTTEKELAGGKPHFVDLVEPSRAVLASRP